MSPNPDPHNAKEASAIDPQIRLLTQLESSSRRSHLIQFLSFIFGVVVSSATIFQQVFNFGEFRNPASVFVVISVLGFGFTLIFYSLTIQSRRDSDVPELLMSRKARSAQTAAEPNNLDSNGSEKHDSGREALGQTESRMSQHVNRLRAFAFANIIIGSIIAAAGIIVIFSLFSRVLDVSFDDLGKIDNPHYLSFFVIVFLPRISIVVLIQIFAYFFLSMYRANLREIRYFQIELNDLSLVGEAIGLGRKDPLSPHQAEMIDKLFEMARYRGDTFRLGVVSDEALETFKALSLQGNLLDRLKLPFWHAARGMPAPEPKPSRSPRPSARSSAVRSSPNSLEESVE